LTAPEINIRPPSS